MSNEKRLIDANVAIKKCNKLLDNGFSCPNPAALEGVKIVRNLILSESETGCPTVDAVEVVHGRWEEIGVADYKCSRCGFRFTSADPISMFQYCRCGAKMDGGNEDV